MKQLVPLIAMLFVFPGCHTRGIAEDHAVEQDRQHHLTQRKEAPPMVYPGGPSWPSFRGPDRDGISDSTPLLKSWPKDGPPQRYRQPIGGGYASFAIADGRAFTIEQRRDKEIVSAYQLETGLELWTHAYNAFFKERLGGDGPRATPTWSKGRVYSMGAQGDLFCLDAATGRKLWHRNILREKKMDNLNYGMCGAPLVVDNRVFITTSGKGGPGVVALEADTGKTLWEGAPVQQGYGSLNLVELAGRKQLLNLAGTSLNGIDPNTGKTLWHFPWKTSMAISVGQPLVVNDDQIFISTGYGKGAALIKIMKKKGDAHSPVLLWSNILMKNKFTSSVIHKGTVYGLNEGILTALDLTTGKRLWRGKDYGHGQVLLADGHLLITGEQGLLAWVEASPTAFKEISSTQAFTSRTWNTPAIAGGLLLLRNDREMVCYDLKAP